MKRMGQHTRFKRFIKDISTHTPFIKLVWVMVFLWLFFSYIIYYAEVNEPQSKIQSYGEALYWGVAAFSTAGIADTPVTSSGKFFGGLWIVVGSVLFFGTIVATVTTYFMRPLQKPHKRIIETIEYNLEQLNELTLEELDLLKQTVDTLIEHVETLKEKQQPQQST